MINRIYNEDCLTGLKKLESKSVHCCVTSPPYYGLRDYGTATWQGGDEGCNHKEFLGGHGEASLVQLGSKGTQQYNYKSLCKKCGAIRIDDQIGLENSPEAYVSKLVEVFREVKRVLRDDGTLWLNLGDSYANNGSNQPQTQIPHNKEQEGYHRNEICKQAYAVPHKKNHGIKPKDLIGIPWMVAFALRADGWYLRQDIIWHKPNPMPESVTDRCTKSHEYIFLLSKSAKYYYDADAIKQPIAESSLNDTRFINGNFIENRPERGYVGSASKGSGFLRTDPNGANKRSVWTVTTKPYSEVHFATFPEDLIVDCVKAGCPEQGIVLDPFMGAGTTALVAAKLNRNFIGFELNEKYIKIAESRLREELGMFNTYNPA